MIISTNPNINLGKVKVGESKNFNFTIKNSGISDNAIKNIHVGCGSCTNATCDSYIIKSNQTLPLNVTFTPSYEGIQKKYVNVTFTSGENLKLEFTADVYR